MSAQSRISITPNPPEAGKTAKVCYDFIGSGITSTVLDVEFTPPTGSGSYPVSIGSPCVDVPIPDGAEFVLITDQDGVSEPLDRVVV